jgi:hypothetical protein
MKQKLGTRAESDPASPDLKPFIGCFAVPIFKHTRAANHGADAANARRNSSGYPNPETIFLRLCHLRSIPIERINRYETAL